MAWSCPNCRASADECVMRAAQPHGHDYRCECGYLHTFGRQNRDRRRRTFNAATEAARWREAGGPTRSFAEFLLCLDRCAACPAHRMAEHSGVRMCAESGAILRGPVGVLPVSRVPAIMATSGCPLGFWGPRRILWLARPGERRSTGRDDRPGGRVTRREVTPATDLAELQEAICDVAPAVVFVRPGTIAPDKWSRLKGQHRYTRFVQPPPPAVTDPAPTDVLMVMPAGPHAIDRWGVDTVDVLRRCAIDAMAVTTGNSLTDLLTLIVRHQPRVVINRAFHFPAAAIAVAAARHPRTVFLTVNHSSQSHLPHGAGWMAAQHGFMRLAAERRNCWYGTPDERNWPRRLSGCWRCIWVPNAVRAASAGRPGRMLTPARVSIACRADVIKNVVNQAVALAIAARHREVAAVLCLGGNLGADVRELLEAAGVPTSVLPWSDRATWWQRIRDSIDIGMQVSFSESFNFVALDHLQAGKPVIGSRAIRYLPRDWQADADDPSDIACRIVDTIDQYEARSEISLEVAERVARQCNQSLVSTIAGLLASEATHA